MFSPCSVWAYYISFTYEIHYVTSILLKTTIIFHFVKKFLFSSSHSRFFCFLSQTLVLFSKRKIEPKTQGSFLCFACDFLKTFKRKRLKTQCMKQSNRFIRNCILEVIFSNLNLTSAGNTTQTVKHCEGGRRAPTFSLPTIGQ